MRKKTKQSNGYWVEFKVDSEGYVSLKRRNARVRTTDSCGFVTKDKFHWSQWNLLITDYIGKETFTDFGGYQYEGMTIWSMCPLIAITLNNPMNFGNGDSDLPLTPTKLRMWAIKS